MWRKKLRKVRVDHPELIVDNFVVLSLCEVSQKDLVIVDFA
jgi:hypothetical protein